MYLYTNHDRWNHNHHYIYRVRVSCRFASVFVTSYVFFLSGSLFILDKGEFS